MIPVLRTLRARITIAAAIILAIAAAVVGIVTSQLARDELISPIDQRLERIAEGFPRLANDIGNSNSTAPPGSGLGQATDRPPEPPRINMDPTGGARPEGRDAAVLRYIDDQLIVSVAAGFSGEEVSLPVLGNPERDAAQRELANGAWRLTDLTSADGSIDYRAVVISTTENAATAMMIGAAPSNGQTTTTAPATATGRAAAAATTDVTTDVITVFAIPLTTVDATVGRIRVVSLLVSVIALGLAALLIWWTVRRSLRPVSDIAALSAQIGPDNLSVRIPPPSGAAEVTTLATSINNMLDDLESAQVSEKAARTALSQFVADASHELRTPIAAVSGHAELMASPQVDDDTRSRSLGRIQSESARMRRLVDNLLTLAAHDTGHRLPKRPINLSGIAIDALEDARAIDPERTYVNGRIDDVRVMGDPVQLMQIVTNLLANVRTHTPPATTATVDVFADGSDAVVRVADTGPGISSEVRPRLFERFIRRNDAGVKTGGAGLGLAIVTALVDEHDGTVQLADSAPGGTVFEVRIPVAPVPTS